MIFNPWINGGNLFTSLGLGSTVNNGVHYRPSIPLPYANNTHTGTTCFNVTDEYGNKIGSTDANNIYTPHNYQLHPQTIYRTITNTPSTVNSAVLSEAAVVDGIRLDQKANIGESVTVIDESNPTGTLVRFKDSQVCFDIRSRAP
jgi:hypothetical protein